MDNMQSAIALYEVVCEDDKVKDLRLLWANKMYVEFTSEDTLEEAEGKLFSHLAKNDSAWIPMYGDVALQKIGTQIIESYSDVINSYIHVQAYSPAPGQVATILQVRSKFVQAELKKEQDEQKIRSMIGLLPEGILFGTLICDELKRPIDIRCEYVNQALEIYEGVIVNTLQGKNFYEMYPNHNAKSDLEKCAEAIRDNKKINYIREGASNRLMEIDIYPQGDNQIFIVERDITEQKRLESVEIAGRAKDKFLAHMSHEIRTPMNSIIGFSELAMDDDITPKTRDYFEKILKNSEWLLQIINDLLDISRIESGKMILENIPFDLHEIFNACRTLILPRAMEKGLELYFYAEPAIGKRLYGDPTRLRQVLVNLLTNAVKFTKSGVIKMKATIKNSTEISVTMSFEVKDSGIGLTDEQMKIIFDPFTQGESGTVREYGGSGLGLSITKNIVELMGGKLSVESTPGEGSVFSFEVTFKASDVDGEIVSAEKVILGNLDKPTFEGEVLLCEDNAMNQQVICEHLSRVGLTPVIAQNGRAGVDMVKQRIGAKQFDLVFMDIHMPVMDGIEASALIKKIDASIPIVAMTANIMSGDTDVYKRSGMNDCVGKPFTSQELWRCLVKYFKPISWQKEDEQQRKHADDELHKKLVENFLRINKTKATEISDAINSGDILLAHRLAHTLKSNAAQLNKHSLRNASEAIELQLKKGQRVSPQQINTLNASLAEVLRELEKKDSQPATAAKSLDAKSTNVLFEKLFVMLQEHNPECFELLDDLRRIPACKKLIRQIEDFQFELAITTLANLQNGKEI
jgi:signal transduction histidine kinase/CheY-like chemotaxis protein